MNCKEPQKQFLGEKIPESLPNNNQWCVNLKKFFTKANTPVQLRGKRLRRLPSRRNHSESNQRANKVEVEIKDEGEDVHHKEEANSLDKKESLDRTNHKESSFSLPDDEQNFKSMVHLLENLKKVVKKRQFKFGPIKPKENKDNPTQIASVGSLMNSEACELGNNSQESTMQVTSQQSLPPREPQECRLPTDSTKSNSNDTFHFSKIRNLKKSSTTENESEFHLFKPRLGNNPENKLKLPPSKIKISRGKKGSFLKNIFGVDPAIKYERIPNTASLTMDIDTIRKELRVSEAEPINMIPKFQSQFLSERCAFAIPGVAFVDPFIAL